MNFTQPIAKHFREVHFGGNWTSVNLKDSLADVTWQQAITKVYSLNTIADLVYHTNYYYRNIHGVIEHTHYHLGQIVLIKKILAQSAGTSAERDVK